MPRCSRVEMKSRKPGPSSIPSKMRGTQKKMHRVCSFIPPAPGARKKPRICSRAMVERGEGCEYCSLRIEWLNRSVKTAEERNDLKEAVKAALIEVLHEREDLLREALTEALEEIGLIRAMEEAEDSPVVNREKIDRLLKRGR